MSMMKICKTFCGIGVVVAGLLATGCHTKLQDKGYRNDLRLAVITWAVEAKFFEPVKKGMNDTANMLGVHCDFMGTEGIDIPTQADMV